MFLPLYSLVMDWVFPLKLSYRIESLRIWEHLMYVLSCLFVVIMGYSHDPLDVCFGDQLVGSAHEPMHRGWHTFSSWLSGRNFGALFEVILSDWVFKDLRTLDVCLVMLICGDSGISRDPLDVCFGDQLASSSHEPMHRGWHTFSSWPSGRNFGAL